MPGDAARKMTLEAEAGLGSHAQFACGAAASGADPVATGAGGS
jgi:hypothetical protein